jgi:hypothetical protein
MSRPRRFIRRSIGWPSDYNRRVALVRCYPNTKEAVLQHIRTIVVRSDAPASGCTIDVGPPVSDLPPMYRTELESSGYTVVSEAR